MNEQDRSETYIDWHFPEPSEWHCIAFGVSYTPVKGHHPNWFHRQMCLLLLGVRWVKDKGGES